jgi:hypothetical protein
MKCARQIDRDDAVPLIGAIVLDRLAVVDSHAVHEDVQTPQPLAHPRDAAAGGAGLAEVDRLAHGHTAVESAQPVGADVENADLGAGIDEPGDQRSTQGPRAARHQRAAAVQSQPIRHSAAPRDV